MKTSDRIINTLRTAGILLALAGFLSAPAGLARASDAEGPKKGDAAAREAVDAGVKKEEGPAAKAAPGDPAMDASALAGQKEKLSYALGMVLGNQFRDQSIEVDLDLYARGLKDGLSGGETLLTEPEARSAVSALQGELKRKRAAPKKAGPTTGIAVSFKLDPSLTKSMFMGDRWISPPTFTSTLQEGKEITVEARAAGRDAKGRATAITPEWTPEDPGMVTVTPGRGGMVKITVRKAGKSKLKVTSAKISKELSIKATDNGTAIQVEISQ